MNKDTINQIIKSARIEEVVSEFVELEPRGASLIGRCPFHNGKEKTFSVAPQKRIFKCFTCGEGGDVIMFLKKFKGFTFIESVEWLAKKYQISIDETVPESKIVYIDTEVSAESQKVRDYGAVREDGTVLHTKSKKEFESFVLNSKFLCGHNILKHDLKYLQLQGNYAFIDTLPLSPLLFPRKPYHHLLKDDKLQVDELNNPANDAMKARDLFYDELQAWQRLSSRRRSIYRYLLSNALEFKGFFILIEDEATSHNQPIDALVKEDFKGKICANANVGAVAKHYPIELAYSLAVISADDLFSLTPSWVLRNYPKVNNVMEYLCNTPCGKCEYCEKRLDVHKGLKEFFGYDHFREFDGEPMQQHAVEAAIRGDSILTIFPTGGGKSLTFQLPALMAGRNIHGLTVVISPLQSLMKDQVDNLNERGISEVVTINGLLDPIERASAIERVSNGTANLLYIAPEMLRSRTIERLLINRNVVRFVVDEAHCFSAWGQDFRTDYLYIGDFIRKIQEKKQQVKPIPVSCFTATAKQKVISDICDYFKQKLGIVLSIFAASSERKNLRYSVLHAGTDDEKYMLLRNLILGHNCSTIVYVSRTKRTREVAERLCRDGINALPFNGKMESAEKVMNQNAFMNGRIQVMVATSAFGMGVDKKDVGLVIHYDISDSLENYIQEAGRAGRDPQMQANCFVLFDDSDLDKHFVLLNQTKLSISEIQQVWQVMKDLTIKREQVNSSPLEIARQAGWNDDDRNEIETRLKGAITALEQAGFISRGNNSPHIFATSIKVRSMEEVRQRLADSTLFDSITREEATRIIHSLISGRISIGDKDSESESRIEYLADILGLKKESVIRSINLMRQEGILADTRDMQAYIDHAGILRNLEGVLRLERFLLERITQQTQIYNYKKLNAETQENGFQRCSVKQLRTLLHFLYIKGYIRKEEHSSNGDVSLHLQTDKDVVLSRVDRRGELCKYVANHLISDKSEKKVVTFSMIDLLNQFNEHQSAAGLFARYTVFDIEEALLFLSKTDLLRIEGGFMVVYNTMQLRRTVERTRRYGKDQYHLLDEFYRQRVQQIHIVGEYANMMVRDYNAAMQFVSDYFLMDYRAFIVKYFKGNRRAQILQNITPAKYEQIFGALSAKQRKIINDKTSKYIVVAAGPGSGKTRVLVHKLASLLLMEDVKHEQLLMLTFSRAAATEFKKRLIELVGNAAHFVEIKTFHSYSFDLIGRQSSMEEFNQVVLRAAKMIESGEVEANKIGKSVLVIDEAQDMAEEDYRLVRALMKRNEEMRVIAVGDDDQNIFAFRGSDSRYMRSLVTEHNAKLYELTDNYRSDSEIVSHANRFVLRLPDRMKRTPISSVSKERGDVKVFEETNAYAIDFQVNGSTAVLTETNEQALQVAYMLEQQGKHVRLIQATDGFSFVNLSEIRYFLSQIGSGDNGAISRERWDNAKQRTEERYANSRCLDVIRRFFVDYESTHKAFYRSEVRDFALESSIEDFVSEEKNTVFVSTMHKAKGREFDNVYILLTGNYEQEVEMLRVVYVGITRARHNLFLYKRVDFANAPIAISLSLRDVWLSYFRNFQKQILNLRSGNKLEYDEGYLLSPDGTRIASLSQSMRERIKKLGEKGYVVIDVEVSYTLSWHPREEPHEFTIFLANITLEKKTMF